MYCQNCGEKIGDGTNICPFCGYSNEGSNELFRKERQIEELKEKVHQLERIISNTTTYGNKTVFNRMMYIFIFVFPIAFLIFFFILFFILANR